jgi:hypothetical protein
MFAPFLTNNGRMRGASIPRRRFATKGGDSNSIIPAFHKSPPVEARAFVSPLREIHSHSFLQKVKGFVVDGFATGVKVLSKLSY